MTTVPAASFAFLPAGPESSLKKKTSRRDEGGQICSCKSPRALGAEMANGICRLQMPCGRLLASF